MESIGILRALLRRPLLLVLGALLALAVGVLASYRVSLLPPGLQSRMASAGFARQRLLVDTPTSLIADARAKGAPAIVIRTTILADQMEGDGVRAALAEKMGVPPGAIGVISSTTATPETESPLAKQALEATRPSEPYVVSLGLEAGQPILTVLATAPDADAAAALARATTTSLTAAARRASPARGAVRVERIGAAEVGSKQVGGGKKKAAIGVLLILAIWCSAIVLADGARRRRRRSHGWGERRGAEA
jgi:hypothetical protein